MQYALFCNYPSHPVLPSDAGNRQENSSMVCRGASHTPKRTNRATQVGRQPRRAGLSNNMHCSNANRSFRVRCAQCAQCAWEMWVRKRTSNETHGTTLPRSSRKHVRLHIQGLQLGVLLFVWVSPRHWAGCNLRHFGLVYDRAHPGALASQLHGRWDRHAKSVVFIGASVGTGQGYGDIPYNIQ